MSNFLESASVVFNNPLATSVLLLFLLGATYTDVKYLKIYNKFNLTLVITRIIFLFLPVYAVKFDLGNIVASISVFIIMLTFGVIFMHKMGGDIKFLTAFMLFFNFEFMLIFMTTASVVNLFYSIMLKRYLLKQKKKVIEENQKECDCDIIDMSLKDKINYQIVKILMVKQPTVNELVSMNERELKKFKMPFAPFFLISYIILMVVYYLSV